jgi:hypothetical protein
MNEQPRNRTWAVDRPDAGYPGRPGTGRGEYDFPILQAAATWYVVILDEADQPLSSAEPVHFDPLEACWYRLDWQRID